MPPTWVAAGLIPSSGGAHTHAPACAHTHAPFWLSDVYSKRFLPPWTYNPDEGGPKKTTAQAKAELAAVVKEQKGAKIIKETDNVCAKHLCSDASRFTRVNWDCTQNLLSVTCSPGGVDPAGLDQF